MRNIFAEVDRRWWACERKKRHETKPPPVAGMRSYSCVYCSGWHMATANSGFFASLTSSQKEQALGYRGPENHGDPRFRKSAENSQKD